MQLKMLNTYEEIAQSFDAFLELRPHLTNVQDFTKQVLQQQKEGYQIFAIIKDEEILASIGFRIMTTLAWGKILYIDDLVTKGKNQGKGYGKILLDHAKKIAHDNKCAQIHLDTGYARHAAHKLYINQGFEFCGHHFAFKLK